MSRFQAKKAERTRINAKIALMAPSGGGKTYGALRLATGMKEEIEKQEGRKARILMANTEGRRGYYYADEFEYEIIDLEAPYEPELFIDAIQYAEDEKFDILIIDSTSHEWEGKGGCLELQQKAGGTYQAWGKVTPRHEKFINKIADSNLHIIATMRGKDQYVMNTNDRGKATVEKLGVGAKQRDGFEYEFTCTFLIDQKTSMSEPQKDNTHIFEKEGSVRLSEEHGKKIIQWANASKVEPPKATRVTKSQSQNTDKDDLQDLIKKIDIIAKEKAKIDKTKVVPAIKQAGHTSANYNSIKDLEVAKRVIEELSKIN